MKRYEFDAVIVEDSDSGGAYVIFPWDIRKEFGKGRVKVHATFDGIPYEGSIVNMGVKDEKISMTDAGDGIMQLVTEDGEIVPGITAAVREAKFTIKCK